MHPVNKRKTHQKNQERCDWCQNNLLYQQYHDEEWGVPVFDDNKLFEFLLLEGAQAGLSWLTILKRRNQYRRVFAQFNASKIARFSPKKMETILKDPGIVRNRLKVQSAVKNARAFLEIQANFQSFARYSWDFVNGEPIINRFKKVSQIPPTSKESIAFSKDLHQRGFSFVGPTIMYAYMQAIGMVNDHITSCFRYEQLIKKKYKQDT